MTNLEFQGRRDTASPGLGSFTVTPSDSVNFTEPCRQLVVFGSGTITFIGLDGVADTWTLAATSYPVIIPVAATRVNATGTTIAVIKGVK